MMEIVLKDIVGQGENASYKRFLLFQQRFLKPFISGSLGIGLVS